MKMNRSNNLCLFTVVIVLLSFSINALEMSTEANMKGPFKGYFWVQRMFPGSDPIDNIKESEFHTRRVLIEANDEMIFFREGEKKEDEIEDSISLGDLYDPKQDNALQGQCCKRISFEEFPAGNSLTNIIPAVPSTSKGKSAAKDAKSSLGKSNSASNKLNPVFSPSKSRRAEKRKSARSVANYCLLLHVPEEARWRICHENQQEVAKLQLKVIYTVLRIKAKAKAGLMESFLNQIKVGSVENLPFWTWENQNKWGGRCQSTNLQSPININRKDAIPVEPNFGIAMHLTDVQTLVKKNFNEIIVTFLKFGGVLKLTVENTYLLFTPQYMSFRFPGESIVDGRRSQGDILLHFAELSSERVI